MSSDASSPETPPSEGPEVGPELRPDVAVPKLPRGRGLRLSRPELVRIAGMALVLVFLVMMQRPCSNAVSTFVTGFGDRGSAGSVMPRPASAVPAAGAGSAAPDLRDYVRLRPGMSEDEFKRAIDETRVNELKRAIDQARVKAAGSGTSP